MRSKISIYQLQFSTIFQKLSSCWIGITFSECADWSVFYKVGVCNIHFVLTLNDNFWKTVLHIKNSHQNQFHFLQIRQKFWCQWNIQDWFTDVPFLSWESFINSRQLSCLQTFVKNQEAVGSNEHFPDLETNVPSVTWTSFRNLSSTSWVTILQKPKEQGQKFKFKSNFQQFFKNLAVVGLQGNFYDLQTECVFYKVGKF